MAGVVAITTEVGTQPASNQLLHILVSLRGEVKKSQFRA